LREKSSNKGLIVIKLAYELHSEPELEAFFSAFFNFVAALSLTDSDAVSVSTGPSGHPWDRVVTFGNETEAEEFRDYWAQRQKWLGLEGSASKSATPNQALDL
jgi:hypothetical protein